MLKPSSELHLAAETVSEFAERYDLRQQLLISPPAWAFHKEWTAMFRPYLAVINDELGEVSLQKFLRDLYKPLSPSAVEACRSHPDMRTAISRATSESYVKVLDRWSQSKRTVGRRAEYVNEWSIQCVGDRQGMQDRKCCTVVCTLSRPKMKPEKFTGHAESIDEAKEAAAALACAHLGIILV
ncbi:hypothetical protein JCM10908_005865 [Rhodotorula pacifica]|uniref:uncharacterized protein n=1 Tax=Rhodotorula pacifica TaxID=1495444 RepID=UPI00317BFE50